MSISKVSSMQERIIDKLNQSEDIVSKKLQTEENYIEVLYIKTISNETVLYENLIIPFFDIRSPERFLAFLQSYPKIKPFKSEEQAINDLLTGITVLFYQHSIYLFDNKADLSKSGNDTKVETSIQGPQIGFTESISTNLGLIRNRYPKPSLSIESTSVGEISKTKVVIIYDPAFSDNEVVRRVKKFLSGIEVPIFQSGEQLLNYIKKNNKALIPLMLVTERPDRVAVNLAGGKVILLISGSPFAVILPTVMKDFMASMEDSYQTYWVACFLQILRYIGFAISLLLPGAYVVVTSYNPELVRIQLALSIAGSRAEVPYPTFVEVLLMLIMMELLTEASIRLPKAIGPTATTVGGLILGQAATQAGLVSDIMIIIVSAVAISNFVVPVNTFSFSVRIVKYIILALSTFFGLIGLVIGFFMFIAYLVKQDSFGQPFLTFIQNKPMNNKSEK